MRTILQNFTQRLGKYKETYYWQPSKSMVSKFALPSVTRLSDNLSKAHLQTRWLNSILEALKKQQYEKAANIVKNWQTGQPYGQLIPVEYVTNPPFFNTLQTITIHQQGITFADLAKKYCVSNSWNNLSSNSRRIYKLYIHNISAQFTQPIRSISNQDIDTYYQHLCNTISISTANAVLRVFYIITNYGYENDYLPSKLKRSFRYQTAKRDIRIFTQEEIARLIATSEKKRKIFLTTAIMIAYWTGQRVSDILSLRWDDYRDNCLFFSIQKKRGYIHPVPVSTALKTYLDDLIRPTDYIVSHKGKRLKYDFFKYHFVALRNGLACEFPDITQKRFHDFRTTFCTHLAQAGVTTTGIASLSSHELSTVNTMLDKHYLGDRIGIANQSMQYLEKHRNEKTSHSNLH